MSTNVGIGSINDRWLELISKLREDFGESTSVTPIRRTKNLTENGSFSVYGQKFSILILYNFPTMHCFYLILGNIQLVNNKHFTENTFPKLRCFYLIFGNKQLVSNKQFIKNDSCLKRKPAKNVSKI